MEKLEIEEIITEAIMSNTPTIIVEGLDDIKFYDNICSRIGIETNIQAIETIEGYTEGCVQVEKAINDIQNNIIADTRIKKFILGIIDCDAKKFRNELIDIDCLFILKYYSYETHLITRFALKKLVSVMTRASEKMVDDSVIDFIMSDIQLEYDKLYYFALEALKNSCDPSYDGIVGYGNSPGSILDKKQFEKTWLEISMKIDDLNLFANEKNITKDHIKYIAKGKWVLHLWSNHLLKKTKELKDCCGDKIRQCKYCDLGVTEKCLWKVKGNHKHTQITQLLCSSDYFDYDELDYIVERFKLLG